MQAQGMRAVDLPGLLAAFRIDHPGVDVRIRHSGGSSQLAREVQDGHLDLAFLSLPGPAPPGVEVIPLLREPIMVAVLPAHPFAGRDDLDLAELREETLVDLPAGWGIRMAVDRSFAAAGVNRKISYEVNDTATLVEFIRNGLGIGLLPRSLVEDPGEIRWVPIRDHAPAFETGLAVPANRRLSAAARVMLEAIRVHTGA
jgi:DNA-binding transcriptional LysR family regulator